jgi:hypothetical protein
MLYKGESSLSLATIGEVDVAFEGTPEDGATRVWILGPKGNKGVELVIDSIPEVQLKILDDIIREDADERGRRAYEDAMEHGYRGPRKS